MRREVKVAAPTTAHLLPHATGMLSFPKTFSLYVKRKDKAALAMLAYSRYAMPIISPTPTAKAMVSLMVCANPDSLSNSGSTVVVAM